MAGPREPRAQDRVPAARRSRSRCVLIALLQPRAQPARRAGLRAGHRASRRDPSGSSFPLLLIPLGLFARRPRDAAVGAVRPLPRRAADLGGGAPGRLLRARRSSTRWRSCRPRPAAGPCDAASTRSPRSSCRRATRSSTPARRPPRTATGGMVYLLIPAGSCSACSCSASGSSTARRRGSRRSCERADARSEERARRAEEALEEALAERNRLWAELQRRNARRGATSSTGEQLAAQHRAARAGGRSASPLRYMKRFKKDPRRDARGSRRGDQAAPARHVSVVTVAIPVLNGARYLDEVLSAVRAQRIDRELEILIVDSGSTDGSLEIARRHGARHPRDRQERVLARRHAQPHDGHGARRPRGVHHAGRDARPRRVARGAARGLRAGGRRGGRVRPARGAAGREPHDQVGDGAPLRELGPRARDRRAAARHARRTGSPSTAASPASSPSSPT